VREVALALAVPGREAGEVFDALADSRNIARLVDVVESVVHLEEDGASALTAWTVRFATGPLRWTERDEFDRALGTIAFRQTEGDFDDFAGRWSIAQDGRDVRVLFSASFDFGVPALSGVLEPIAARTLIATMTAAVVGLFPGTVAA
jgi:ribosome-associated toxin RatA of RatAB toxin-antitoxin module